VAIARENGVAKGRKLRVDTTVVETNIHYPTDSSLLGDGVRALTRVMKRVSPWPARPGPSYGIVPGRSNSACWRLRAPAATRPERVGRN